MGEQRHERIAEWLDIDLGRLSAEERKTLIMEIFDTLNSGDLRELRDIAEQKRTEKLEETRNAVLERMREELEEAGIDPLEIQVSFGRHRRSRAPLAVKYQSPEGQTWSGRGFAPNWLTKLEAEGHNREEYRVEEAGSGTGLPVR
jgi:DNA-binding protein H-NS